MPSLLAVLNLKLRSVWCRTNSGTFTEGDLTINRNGLRFAGVEYTVGTPTPTGESKTLNPLNTEATEPNHRPSSATSQGSSRYSFNTQFIKYRMQVQGETIVSSVFVEMFVATDKGTPEGPNASILFMH